MKTSTITFGHSPDADDAFMFWGIASGRVDLKSFKIQHCIKDIESLNTMASTGELDVTAISAARYPAVSHIYRIMSCGASIGRNYGPVVVSKSPKIEKDLKGATIGVPGKNTTSWLLYRIFAPDFGAVRFLNFDRVEESVASGEVDFGILLHEGQILYEQRGFYPVLNLGKRWFDTTSLPIPLGIDVVSRNIPIHIAQSATNLLAKSIVAARKYEDEAIDYALKYGRGISKKDATQFVRMYVNDDTLDMGQEGIKALETLYSMAHEKGVITQMPKLDLMQAVV